jgi:hypothetical protein
VFGLALFAVATVPTAVACGGPDAAGVDERAKGALRLGPSAELEGTRYWLEATFYVSGPESTWLGSGPGNTSLVLDLTPGSYTVELASKWRSRGVRAAS